MRLNEVLSQVPVIHREGPDIPISGIAYDSRSVRQGDLFAAVAGFKSDGHDFVPQAVAAGAAALLTGRWINGYDVPQCQTGNVRRSMALAAANYYGHPSRQLSLIGVTGTNGKTTTTFMIDAILKEAGRRAGLIGGIEYRTGGDPVAALRTTPESVDLQRMLAEMTAVGLSAATLEVSSHGIDLYRVAFTEFDVAVLTNLTSEHLDLHGEMESYFQTKRRLFNGELAGKEKDARAGRPAAVVNVDDAYGMRLSSELDNVLTVGLSKAAQVTAERVELNGWESRFRLVTPQGAAQVSLHFPASYNIANALAAAGAAVWLEIPADAIARGLSSLSGVPGRFELIDTPGTPFQVVVDYAHNQDGLAQALAAAREPTRGQLIVVFGCPGERDRAKRPEMGRTAGEIADLTVLTTDDCYGEPPDQILDETEEGLVDSGGRYLRIPDRRRAIAAAMAAAGPGDTVLVAGKGHETRQIMAKGPRPFSDKAVVKEIAAG